MESWTETIEMDYPDAHLLKEDSLKCALYSRLRERFKGGSLRVYPEFALQTGEKADLVIGVINAEAWRKGNTYMSEVKPLAILELKYQNRKQDDSRMLADCAKLFSYRDRYKGCLLYGCFIHEKIRESDPQWLLQVDDCPPDSLMHQLAAVPMRDDRTLTLSTLSGSD